MSRPFMGLLLVFAFFWMRTPAVPSPQCLACAYITLESSVLLKESGIILNGEWTDAQRTDVTMAVRLLAQHVGSTQRLRQLLGGYAGLYAPDSPDVRGCYGADACAFPAPLRDGHSVYFLSANAVTTPVVIHELLHLIDWRGNYSSHWYVSYNRKWPPHPVWEMWAEGVTRTVYVLEYSSSYKQAESIPVYQDGIWGGCAREPNPI